MQDYRRFGRVMLGTHAELRAARALPRLGPEPFEGALSLGDFSRIVGSSQRPIKAMMLDQGRLAGLGNIYCDEALFRAGIRPTALASRLGSARRRRLYDAIEAALGSAVNLRGTTIDAYRDGTRRARGEPARPARVWARRQAPAPDVGDAGEDRRRRAHHGLLPALPALSQAEWRLTASNWFAALAGALLVLSALTAAHVLAADDRVLLHLAQIPQAGWLDAAMVAISFLGSLEFTTPLALAATLLAWRVGARAWWLPLLLFLGAVLVELAAKQTIPQPPVPEALQRGSRFGVGVATRGSFPSGHMTRVTLVCGWLTLAAWSRRSRSAWLWGCIAVVWLIGYSRLYLGSHWPADVAGGILLGGAALAICLALAPGAVLMRPDREAYPL